MPNFTVLKQRDMKPKIRKDKDVQYRGHDNELMRNYNIRMQIAKRGPKITYERDGSLKSIK